MKLLRILRPVIAFIAAIAAGVAGAVIAAQFLAPPSTQYVAPDTEVAPVIEPVGYGASAPEGDPFDVSRAVANTEIALGGGAGGVDAATRSLLDELTESDDPGDAGGGSVTPYDETAPPGSSAGDDDGDPCAPRDGEPATDCPEGLHSTVLALVAPENPFYVIASANPPTYADSPYRLLFCDPQTHDEFGLPIGVATNAPASITMRYWPSGDPSDGREIHLETSADVRAAWENGLAATGFTGDWTRPQHCLVIPDLEEHVTYRASFEATDILGRTDSYDWGFQLPDDRTVPPTRVVPMSDSIIFVSAPHIATQAVDVRAWNVEPGVEASCGNPAATSARLEVLQEPETTEVSSDYLERHDYRPEYTKRTSSAYWVPEGSTILVCLRWTDPDRPSWDWEASLRQFEQVFQSPDRMVPIVSLAGVSLARTVAADAISLSGRTREGEGCGGWVGPDAETSAVELPASLPVICAPFVSTASTRGDVVVDATVTQGDSETSQSSVLPLSHGACRGVCPLPETSWYRVSLPTVRVGTGMCGSSFGPCDPPTAEVSAGTALLRVDWAQGNTNGQADWASGLPSEGTVERLTPLAPQMNTFEQLTATPAGAIGAYNLGFRLQTDRPVTYNIHLVASCTTDGLVTDVTGTSTGVAMINFGRVCLGSEYRAEVELIDDAGHRSLWTQTPGPSFWPYGFASTPLRETDLSVSYSVSRPGSDILSYVTPLSITVSGARVTRTPSQPCIAGTSVSVNNWIVRDLPLGDRITVAVSIAMHTAYGSATGTIADCDSSDYDGETLSFDTVISRAQLTSPEGVTITAPAGSPYSVTIVIHGA
jgi:hypothetical protein